MMTDIVANFSPKWLRTDKQMIHNLTYGEGNDIDLLAEFYDIPTLSDESRTFINSKPYSYNTFAFTLNVIKERDRLLMNWLRGRYGEDNEITVRLIGDNEEIILIVNTRGNDYAQQILNELGKDKVLEERMNALYIENLVHARVDTEKYRKELNRLYAEVLLHYVGLYGCIEKAYETLRGEHYWEILNELYLEEDFEDFVFGSVSK